MQQTALFQLVVVVLYLAVFAEASLSKLVARETPDWFRDMFASTWLSAVPMPLMWWSIALAELAVAGTMVAALVSGEVFADAPSALLGFGLLGATVVFAGLCFGQRVAIDFAGAANSFYYGALSLLLWFALQLVPFG